MNIIPIQYYTLIFYNFILVVSILVFFSSFSTDIGSFSNRESKKNFGIVLVILLIFYMGLRPVNFRFGDMVIYNNELLELMRGIEPKGNIDPLFKLIMRFFANLRAPILFFFVCAVLYIVPLYSASKKIFGDYWFYSFLMLVCAFTFWEFGVNGIRNGIAGSLFLYAITHKKNTVKYMLFIAILFIHKSLILPMFAFFVAKYIKNVKLYFLFWILCIPISLALGSFLEGFFLNIGFSDDQRVDVYLNELNQVNEGVQLKLGFRWDFIIYSASAVYAAYYFIFVKNIKDDFYNLIVSIYLLSNGFWILIIRANYSNRFAYLSWFMMGIIILYPIIKYNLSNKQHSLVTGIIASYCLLGYLLNVILV